MPDVAEGANVGDAQAPAVADGRRHRRRRRRPVGAGEGGKLEQPRRRLAGVVAAQQPSSVALERHADHRLPDGSRGAARPRVALRSTAPGRAAPRGDRARGAVRALRQADQRPQLHQRLVPLARRAVVGHQLRRAPSQPSRRRAASRVAPQAEPAGQHARHVAVHQRRRAVEGDAGHRRGGVGPDSRQLAQPRRVVRHPTPVPVPQRARRRLEVAGPAVVAEPRPQREHVVLRRRGQGLDRREAVEEPSPALLHHRDPRLLQHELGHQDRVRVARAAPRQVAAVPAVPAEERRPSLRLVAVRLPRHRPAA